MNKQKKKKKKKKKKRKKKMSRPSCVREFGSETEDAKIYLYP